jgi:hypothetical protein
MEDALARLSNALADRYRIERELAAGVDSDAQASARRSAARPEGRRVVHDAPARRAAEPTLQRRNLR